MAATSRRLADGRRLHLHHGPIDIVLEAWGEHRDVTYDAATNRFRSILDELVGELPALRLAVDMAREFQGPVAKRMQAAVLPHLPVFITPMAAVAGAVADEILATMVGAASLDKAYVNDGGDIAVHLSPWHSMDVAIAAPWVGGHVPLHAIDPVRGIATSGWRGRSHSLGIADSVTVLAKDAASADAAATLIANAVDLPGHPAISRTPARHLYPDSDLGDRPVTTGVGLLSAADVNEALNHGRSFAASLLEHRLIHGAMLVLAGEFRIVADDQNRFSPYTSTISPANAARS